MQPASGAFNKQFGFEMATTALPGPYYSYSRQSGHESIVVPGALQMVKMPGGEQNDIVNGSIVFFANSSRQVEVEARSKTYAVVLTQQLINRGLYYNVNNSRNPDMSLSADTYKLIVNRCRAINEPQFDVFSDPENLRRYVKPAGVYMNGVNNYMYGQSHEGFSVTNAGYVHNLIDPTWGAAVSLSRIYYVFHKMKAKHATEKDYWLMEPFVSYSNELKTVYRKTSDYRLCNEPTSDYMKAESGAAGFEKLEKDVDFYAIHLCLVLNVMNTRFGSRSRDAINFDTISTQGDTRKLAVDLRPHWI